MTRKLQRRFVLTVLIAITIAALAVIASSIKMSYLDFGLEYIAKKYQGNWQYMVLELLVYGSLLIGFAMYQGWDKSALRRIFTKPTQTTFHDIAIWLLRVSYLTEILVYLITFGITKKLRWHFRDLFDVDSPWLMTIDNIVVQQLLFLFVLDFFFYWMHRLEHRFPFLWAFHKFHHSATEMNVINSKREHPVESEVFRSFLFAIPFAVLGAPFSSYIIFQIIKKVHTAINHSGVNWSWGWFGSHVLVSPQYHEVHHSKDKDHIDKNFAGFFPILDHVFGTYYSGPIGEIEYGVEDDNHNNTHLLKALWVPFVESFDAIMAWIPIPGNKESELHDSDIKAGSDTS
ncbi:MAG: hypothetical protein DRI69_05895 [Bacteroidetes bacterium]|nr:MAG: hypothetical protein DRI69_05895 [Bacteroidota bacterium]